MIEDQAEKLEDEATEDEEISNPDDEQDPDAEQEAGEGDGEDSEKKDEEGDESDEVELVREVKGSQPTRKTRSFSNRIRKFKGETQEATERADQSDSRVKILEEQMKLKDIQLEQLKNQKPAPVRPNPDDFDGASDPEYIKKQDEFYDHRAAKQIEEKLAENNQAQTETVSRTTQDNKLDGVLAEYHEKAAKICPKDHEAKEDIAIEVLGNKTVNDIITNWEDAPLILYYLGANKDEAESLHDLISRNPVKGVARIERLLTEISFKPKTKKTAPDPDEDLPGGSSSGNKRGPKGVTYT